jgi:hypothetical protein
MTRKQENLKLNMAKTISENNIGPILDFRKIELGVGNRS